MLFLKKHDFFSVLVVSLNHLSFVFGYPSQRLRTFSKPNTFNCACAYADLPPNLHLTIICFDLYNSICLTLLKKSDNGTR